ncbi:MAG: ribonuclease HI [Candidatus Pacebacteria bacterium]|nr:ribonuclease HI [Candidatus Paceibacterota bacterium]MCD8508074.1 ribonuclease HI [Candidatus Paceibacterota bacterium]MCD8528207.1 ribonuclease HI [Candidatus Paceibacterota bacterium]MCD8563846.1 ribonuclease HI [Candidatus Paceibacterota bacterium]
MNTLDSHLYIFTDGSALGNPGKGGYGALLIFEQLDEIIELGGAKPHTTNNEMELSAIIAALAYASHNIAPTTIFTDSSYVVNGITQWVHNWEKNNWRTQDKNPVAHQPLWEQLLNLVRAREQEAPLTWKLVPSHVGIAGNERVDTIATTYAEGRNPTLYRGNLSQYPHALFPLPSDADIQAKRSEKRAANPSSSGSSKAYSYLSLVDDVVMRHDNWLDCKVRVDGKKALFRKALSAEHEQEICTAWGVPLPPHDTV